MKIAFDEHIPPRLAAAFIALQGEESLLRAEIVSARDYGVPKAESDVPWLEKFAADGGQIVVSGDTKMRGHLHERHALSNAGFIVFFLANRWGQANAYTKGAMLLKWWPVILKTIARAKPGQFFEVPFQWSGDELIDVTPPKVTTKRTKTTKRRPKNRNAAGQSGAQTST